MKFLEYTSQEEEEKLIIDEANKAMYDLKRWQKLENKRHILTNNITRGLKLKFPRLTDIYITNNSIELNTELHSNRVSLYTRIEDKNVPQFRCDIQTKDLPDTAEDFLIMKKNIEDDKQEIMTAMNYIRFRYNINDEEY